MKQNQVSLKKNFMMNAILTLSSLLFPLISFQYVSRIILPVGTGKVDFATSIIVYFNIIAQLGMPLYGVRAIAKVRDDKEELNRVAQELFLINIVMTIFSYIVLFIMAFAVTRFQQERTLLFIMSASILLSAIGMEWLYKGLEKYSFITLFSVLFKIIALIGMYLLIHVKEDYLIYGALLVLASSGAGIINFLHARKLISFKKVGKYNFKRHLSAIGIFFAMACATQIYTHLDTVMLGFMKGDEEVGIYNAAVKIKIALVSLVTSLSAVLLPRSSYYVDHEMLDEFKRISSKALNFVMLLSIPLTVYFIIFAKESILFLSGDKYINGVIPMQIIMPTVICIGLTNIMGIQILVPLNKEKTVLFSVLAGSIIDLFINLLLIPGYSAVGAALGTLIAEIVVFIWQFIVLKEDVIETFKKIPAVTILVALLIAIAISIWTKFLGWGSFKTLLVSALLYYVAYYVTLLVAKVPIAIEMKNIVLSRFGKKK